MTNFNSWLWIDDYLFIYLFIEKITLENDRSPVVICEQSKAQFFSVFSENRQLSNNIKKSKKNAKLCITRAVGKKK